jgi:hydrogenase expression/formation protein HypC
MCLAIPSKILKIEGAEAEVEAGGIIKRANLTFLNNPKVGDYVLIHAGFAIQVIDPEEARKTLDMWKDIGEGN